LINENILEKCFRSCSSCCGLSISPLAQQYVSPRWLLLIRGRDGKTRPPHARTRRNGTGGRYRAEIPALHCPLSGLESQQKEGPDGPSLVIPCWSIQPEKGHSCLEHAVLFTVTATDVPSAHVLGEGCFRRPVKEASAGRSVPCANRVESSAQGWTPRTGK